ncbi:MAG: TonB-dependent receptor [Bacteroidetes bacterium]|nr:TonB-dependent receptor [Bacteroidota bacterium]
MYHYLFCRKTNWKYCCIKYFLLPFLLFFSLHSLTFAQKQATVSGTIRDENNHLLEAAHAAVLGGTGGTATDASGKFSLLVPAEQDIILVLSYIGYHRLTVPLNLKPGVAYRIDTSLVRAVKPLSDVTIEDKEIRTTTLTRIDPKTVTSLPNPSGNIESLLKTLPGVSSASELTSQYSVRGGNYDENLVYVNDVEIYRPFLVRSGQQEGLSFVNSRMVSSLLFSAGGFEAVYGDKMSSVLDIKYRKPRDAAGSIDASLLGGSVHFEDASRNYRFSHITGMRYKSSQYLLNSLNTKGDYKPSFTDIQTYLAYDITENSEISFLGNYSRNQYRFIPKTRETSFGTVNEAYRLTVYFDGQEIDDFETMLGALTFSHKPNSALALKFISSAFTSAESEKFDILGQYWIHELEKDMSDEKFGQPKYVRGVGTHLNHARNTLDALVYNVEHKGSLAARYSRMQWGLKIQRESIEDMLSEWVMIDSSGYSVPHPADSPGYTYPLLQPLQEINLSEFLKTKINLNSNRISSYLQKKWFFSDTSIFSFTAGIRISYLDRTRQANISPRFTLSVKPEWKGDFLFRLSGGFYHQPPFYRELRDPDGNIHTDIKSQRSIHAVAGMDHNFRAWDRPFKVVTEIYYKHLTGLIPYKVDNVRIRYLSGELSNGYAGGIDTRINGEFVKGLESWASLSVMQTQEDIIGDYYYEYYNSDGEKIIPGYTWNDITVDSIRYEPGFIPRPTDQRVTFGLFFQDYLPKLPDFKMHLSLLFGTGLPFGPPGSAQYEDTLRIPPYKRVDIGFSNRKE